MSFHRRSHLACAVCVAVFAGLHAAKAQPRIYGAYCYDGLSVGVQFTNSVDPNTATTMGNYAVSGTTVTSVSLQPDGASVALGLGTPISGQFVVTVNNVQDTNSIPIAANSKTTNTVLNLTTLVYGDASSEPSSATYTGNYATLIAGGSDLYGAGDNFVFEYLLVTNDFDYSMKIASISNDGQPFNRSGLMVRDTDNTDIYGHEILNSRNGGPNAGNGSADSAQVVLRLVKDDTVDLTLSEPPNPLPAFYGSNSWVRVQRTGTVFTSYYSSDGVNWAVLYQFDGAVAGDGMFTNSVLYLGMATCAHAAAVDTTNVVSDLGVTSPEPVAIVSNLPASEVWRSGTPQSLTIAAIGVPILYQWRTNGVAIPGATNATYSVAAAAASNAGNYTVVVSNTLNSVTSSVCAVTFSSDLTPPVISGAYSYDGLTVGVEFNKIMNSSTVQTAANYAVTGAAVSSAVISPDGQSGILTLAAPLSGSFTVAVNNVKDFSGNTIAANSKATNTVLNLTSVAIGDAGGQVSSVAYYGNEITNVSGGSDIFNASDNFTFDYFQVTGDFDYRLRVVSDSGNGQAFARVGIMARGDLTSNPQMIMPAVNEGNTYQVSIRTNDLGTTTLSEPPNPLPTANGSNSWVRLQRTGNVFNSYSSSDGATWALLWTIDTTPNPYPNPLYLGIGVGAHSASATTTGVAYDFGSIAPQPPLIYQNPTPQTILYQGYNASLNVGAVGELPLTYQWQSNGVSIPNATNATLSFTNLSPAATASYRLVVTSPNGSVTSSVTALSVVKPNTSYEAAVLAAGPVAYWQFNDTNNPATGTATAFDEVGAFNGTYGTLTTNGISGVNGPLLVPDGYVGFGATNAALETTKSINNAFVTVPALNLANGTNLTITAWIKPASGAQNGFCGVIFCRAGSTVAGIDYNTATTLGYTFNNQQNTWSWNSLLTPPTGTWSFVALVITPASGTLYVFNTNGEQIATNAVAQTTSQPFDGNMQIGNDSAGGGGGRTFNGLIDEIALFDYSMTPAQLSRLYNAAVHVQVGIAASGANLVVSWPQGLLQQATNVTGPWTTNGLTSPATVSPTGPQKFYRLQLP